MYLQCESGLTFPRQCQLICGQSETLGRNAGNLGCGLRLQTGMEAQNLGSLPRF